jgi:hypothetical protein
MSHRPYCMTELGGSCNCGMRHADTISWLREAASLIDNANRQGCRIKSLHLTPEQRKDLTDVTGQDKMLLGYRVG